VKAPFSITFLPVFILLAGCSREEGTVPPRKTSVRDLQDTVADTGAIEIFDASGKRVSLDTPPRRILSLVPSASETLVSLGAGELLVGRTDFDTSGALAHLPSVGGGLNPNPEAILALNPDLVIRFAGDSDPSTPLRLDRLGIPHLAIQPNGIRDIRESILALGLVTRRRERARTLLDRMDETLSEIRERVSHRPRVRVGYLLGGTPPWVAGSGSYIDELLQVAGGENVFSDIDGAFGPVNVEAFLSRPIDLLLASEGAQVHLPDEGIPLRRVPAGVEIPGPGLAEAALELARILHPEAFR